MDQASNPEGSKNYDWKGIRKYYHEREAVLFAARLRDLGVPALISNHHVANPLPLTNPNYEIRVPRDLSGKALDLLASLEAEVDNFQPEEQEFHDISKEEIYYLKKVNYMGITPMRVVILLMVLLLISLIIRAIVNGATSILF